MYPQVFPPHWIKGIWYNLFHPSLFCRINENWNCGETLWLKKVGGKDIWGGFSKGGKDLQGHHVNKADKFLCLEEKQLHKA